MIGNDPTVDNTDLYAFVSPDRPNTVTMVADYIPFEGPARGPNFYNFDQNALYELPRRQQRRRAGRHHVPVPLHDRDAEQEHGFLSTPAPITSLNDPDWNVRQFYSVTRVTRTGAGRLLGTHLASPPNNIGPRSTPDYDSLATAAVNTSAGGIKVFAGQRDDPFFVDLGSIFDLAGLRPCDGHAVWVQRHPDRPRSRRCGGLQRPLGHRDTRYPISALVATSPTSRWARASRPNLRILSRTATGARSVTRYRSRDSPTRSSTRF